MARIYCYRCGQIQPESHPHFQTDEIKDWCGFKYTGDAIPPNRLFAEDTLRRNIVDDIHASRDFKA